MTTFHRILSGLALTSVVVTSGCLHHPELLACVPGAGESECWQSSRADENGLRHHVVERVSAGDRCDTVAVEQTSFDERGALIARVVEERKCRVVERRTTDNYDLVAGVIVREVAIDRDHDDRFDSVQTVELPMSPDQRVFALTTSFERFASLDEARELDGTTSPRGALAKQ